MRNKAGRPHTAFIKQGVGRWAFWERDKTQPHYTKAATARIKRRRKLAQASRRRNRRG